MGIVAVGATPRPDAGRQHRWVTPAIDAEIHDGPSLSPWSALGHRHDLVDAVDADHAFTSPSGNG